MSALAEDLEKCADQHQHLGQAHDPLTHKYGPTLWTLPPGTAAKVETAWTAATALLAGGADADRGASLLAGQQKLRAWTADTLKRLPGWLAERTPWKSGSRCCCRRAQIGPGPTRPPRSGKAGTIVRPFNPTTAARLANLCMADHAPEQSWVQSQEALKAAQALVTAPNRPVLRATTGAAIVSCTFTIVEFFELELDRITRVCRAL